MAYDEELAERIRQRLRGIAPELHNEAISKQGCRTMDFTKRPMSGFVLIDETGRATDKEFDYWIQLALDFNPRAKSSKQKAK